MFRVNNFDASVFPVIPGVTMVQSDAEIAANNTWIQGALNRLNGNMMRLQSSLIPIGTTLNSVYYPGNFIDYLIMSVMSPFGVNLAPYWRNGIGMTKDGKPGGDNAVFNMWNDKFRPWLAANHPEIEQQFVTQWQAFNKSNTIAAATDAKNIINQSKQMFAEVASAVLGVNVAGLFKPTPSVQQQPLINGMDNSIVYIIGAIVIAFVIILIAVKK
jgi:hypothetical protein